jgi:hypothetical protein
MATGDGHSIPMLLGHRAVMRERNLYDTERDPSFLKLRKADNS